MKTIRLLPLAAVTMLAAACADTATEPAAAPAGPSSVVGAAPACVTFGPNPPAWTVWGAPAGHVPGSLVHVENSIAVTVDPFNAPGGPFFNQARLEPAAVIGWGTLNSLHLTNISTTYHFMAAGGWVPNNIRFLYRDLGAIENLAINGALYVGDITGAPAVLGGASVFVGTGVVSITGPVNRLTIGGQDFRVENVCAAP